MQWLLSDVISIGQSVNLRCGMEIISKDSPPDICDSRYQIYFVRRRHLSQDGNIFQARYYISAPMDAAE